MNPRRHRLLDAGHIQDGGGGNAALRRADAGQAADFIHHMVWCAGQRRVQVGKAVLVIIGTAGQFYGPHHAHRHHQHRHATTDDHGDGHPLPTDVPQVPRQLAVENGEKVKEFHGIILWTR